MNKLVGNFKPKILIVDDDLSSQLYISYVVKPICRDVLTASSGDEALNICRNESDIDLILMDIQMPEMNGIAATQKIREFNENVIIIAIINILIFSFIYNIII